MPPGAPTCRSLALTRILQIWRCQTNIWGMSSKCAKNKKNWQGRFRELDFFFGGAFLGQKTRFFRRFFSRDLFAGIVGIMEVQIQECICAYTMWNVQGIISKKQTAKNSSPVDLTPPPTKTVFSVKVVAFFCGQSWKRGALVTCLLGQTPWGTLGALHNCFFLSMGTRPHHFSGHPSWSPS